jgi:type IV fimbrial biogenesis protein FimT
MNIPARSAGFTLFEMMVALGIAAVLLGTAAPSIANLARSNRLSASSRDFVIDLSLARSEAVMRARRVSVCTSEDLETCSNTSWGDGRLVFIDSGTVGDIDGDDAILSRTPALDDALTTTAAGVATNYYISFLPNGRVAGAGQVRLCAENQQERRVNLHRTGQASLDRTTTAC